MSFPHPELTDAFRVLMPAPVRTPRLTRVANIAFLVGSRGTPLVAGDLAFVRVGLNGPSTVLTWSLAAFANSIPQPGTITVEVLSGTSFSSLYSICGGPTGDRPALLGQAELTDQQPSNVWTNTIPDPCWLVAIVVTTDGVIEMAGLTLRVAVGVDSATAVVVMDTSGYAFTAGGGGSPPAEDPGVATAPGTDPPPDDTPGDPLTVEPGGGDPPPDEDPGVATE